ncbi:MAG TPA: manganese-dependent inorganic pyrophosphatase [Patescibacteria group bacterium]|jgi:manganese-dependent inorganic pyrophosphatase
MSKTYVIGHQKPDTDSVVSAMSAAYLFQRDDTFSRPNAQAVIVDPLNPETTFLFKKFGVKTPQLITAEKIGQEDRIVLVDHNEESQRLPGLNPEQIVEIIDHHKANFSFTQPIFLNFKVWGSTNTIIYYFMKQQGIMPEAKLAGLMLAAILSDTVGFKSPITTDKDRKFGIELADLAGITDVDAFTLEIFKAKSDVSTLTDEQIVKNDFKIFEFGKKTFIDQLETVEQERILTEKKTSLLKAMRKIKQTEGVELLFVAITDILQVNTKLLILGDEEARVAQKAFGGQVVNQVLDIGPKLSRKKEIAPVIEKALA